MRMHIFIAIILVSAVLAGCATSAPNSTDAVKTPGKEIPVREDTKTFTLGNRQSIEWKFALDKDAVFQYSWSATRPVFFDFHGDYGDGTDDFVSHKSATLASDQDTFKVPFNGRHGWFWSNGNAQSVTITLTTKGPYEVIGKTGGNAN